MYYQEGRAGSCGEAHSDGDMIAALGHRWMNRQYRAPSCGQRLRATHAGSQYGVPGEGNSVEVTVVDRFVGLLLMSQPLPTHLASEQTEDGTS